MRFRPILTCAMLLPLASAGCAFLHDPLKPFSPTTVQRGIFIDPDRLKELNPGTTTRADVETLLGTPTAKGSFDDNTWIYVAETTHTRIGRMPGVSKQNVLVLSFDEGGVLRGVKGLDQKDAQDVDMVERTTPSPGTEASVMQQLLGNIGKFNPTGAPTSGGSGGLNGPGL